MSISPPNSSTTSMTPLNWAFKETPTLWFMPRESYHNMTDYAACIAVAQAAGLKVVGCTVLELHTGLVLEGKTNGYLDALLHLVALDDGEQA